ncbi:MAG: hypothetical protein D6828_00365, partial [Nitrospirae bacterium]
MNNNTLHTLQINTVDIGGGAARIAWNLYKGLEERGHDSWFCVGYKHSSEERVFSLFQHPRGNPWMRLCYRAGYALSRFSGRLKGAGRLQRILYMVAKPSNIIRWFNGVECYSYPQTWRILDIKHNIIHCHNLHGGYFDLEALPFLSKKAPLFLTLHDSWLLSGHCSASLDCNAWMSGCKSCPYLDLYPAIRRDRAAYNWNKKRDILSKCRLYVATPSKWLMERVENSIISEAIVEAKVIN